MSSKISLGRVFVRALEALLVPVAAIYYEPILHAISRLSGSDTPQWPRPLLLTAYFVVALLFVGSIEGISSWIGHSWNRRRKLKLADVGVVDGKWIGIVRENGGKKVTQMSVLTIETSQDDGFVISGESYLAHDLVHVMGTFWMTSSLATERGVLYEYEGDEYREGEGKVRHHGSCYFIFHQTTDDKRFEGGLFALEEDNLRRVSGRQIKKGEMEKFKTPQGRQELMGNFLESQNFVDAL